MDASKQAADGRSHFTLTERGSSAMQKRLLAVGLAVVLLGATVVLGGAVAVEAQDQRQGSPLSFCKVK
jgi:hypothetical protein